MNASLPTRERGLKFFIRLTILCPQRVAPYAGAWIEILLPSPYIQQYHVAPYAGAWIEICKITRPCVSLSVAPYAGAWIEIP